MQTNPEQWALDVQYLAKLADWASGQGFCQIEGLVDPDEWCFAKWDQLKPESNGDDYSGDALAAALVASILSAVRDAMEAKWLPITDEVKDGREVQLWGEEDWTPKAAWNPTKNAWCYEEWDADWQTYQDVTVYNPTHWQPLPTPPRGV